MLVELDDAGFALTRSVVDEQARDELLRLTAPGEVSRSVHHRSGSAFATRGLLWKVRELPSLLESCGLGALASAVLGERAFPVDATFFDKHARANWAVPGHQDRIVPVEDTFGRKHRVRGGIAYAELDAATLATLVAFRLHFDATDANTGALCVVPGSHRSGVLSTEQILKIGLERYVACAAQPGDVLALRPLLLHRSSPSRGNGQRRVLHVVYAAKQPREGFTWRGVQQPD